MRPTHAKYQQYTVSVVGGCGWGGVGPVRGRTLTATNRPASPASGLSTMLTTDMRLSCEEKANRRRMRSVLRPSGDFTTLPVYNRTPRESAHSE